MLKTQRMVAAMPSLANESKLNAPTRLKSGAANTLLGMRCRAMPFDRKAFLS